MEDEAYKHVGRRIGDVADLPEAIRKMLNATKLDDLEEKIVAVMKNRYEGVASLDELIVGLYREYAYIPDDRRTLANKLYRMAKAGHLESIPQRKGVYKLK